MQKLVFPVLLTEKRDGVAVWGFLFLTSENERYNIYQKLSITL